jgi:hypothetical protein
MRLDRTNVATAVLNEHFHDQFLINFLHVSEGADPGYHNLHISIHLASSHGVFLWKQLILM